LDGVTGLQLLDTATKGATSGLGIGILIILFLIGAVLVVVGVISASDGEIIGIIPLIFGCIFLWIVFFADHKPSEGYNEYKCAITDENYHIDLDKYEVVSTEGKLITLKDKQ
jgi:hypothetical protein